MAWRKRFERGRAGNLRALAVTFLPDNKTDRRLVEFEYDKDGKLFSAHLRQVALAGVPEAEVERLRAEGVALQQRRIASAQAKGKIGRNDRCPCGSGKKWPA